MTPDVISDFELSKSAYFQISKFSAAFEFLVKIAGKGFGPACFFLADAYLLDRRLKFEPLRASDLFLSAREFYEKEYRDYVSPGHHVAFGAYQLGITSHAEFLKTIEEASLLEGRNIDGDTYAARYLMDRYSSSQSLTRRQIAIRICRQHAAGYVETYEPVVLIYLLDENPQCQDIGVALGVRWKKYMSNRTQALIDELSKHRQFSWESYLKELLDAGYRINELLRIFPQPTLLKPLPLQLPFSIDLVDS